MRNRNVLRREKQKCTKRRETEMYQEERNRNVLRREKQKCIKKRETEMY